MDVRSVASPHVDYQTLDVRHCSVVRTIEADEWTQQERCRCAGAIVLGIIAFTQVVASQAHFNFLKLSSATTDTNVGPATQWGLRRSTHAVHQTREPNALRRMPGMRFDKLTHTKQNGPHASSDSSAMPRALDAPASGAMHFGESILSCVLGLGLGVAAVALRCKGRQFWADEASLPNQTGACEAGWAMSALADKGSVHLVGAEDRQDFQVAAFYKFVLLDDYKEIQPRLQKFCDDHNLYGMILLAKEGVNSTVAGAPDDVAALLAYLRSDPRLADLTAKFSDADDKPFRRMKVRLKKEIVTLGIGELDPANGGEYVTPSEWNEGISDPEALVIDVRNDYEHRIGTFANAVNPKTNTFREFPQYVASLEGQKDKKVYMSCTGGIRCEKAAAYMKQQGFKHVYQLKGGILKYLEEVPESESLWQGQCFVFDRRVAVKHGLQPGDYDLCFACGEPLSESDKESPLYEAGVGCARCHEKFDDDDRERFRERVHQMRLTQKRLEDGQKVSKRSFSSKLWAWKVPEDSSDAEVPSQ